MSVFLSDTDAREFAIRQLYWEHLGRPIDADGPQASQNLAGWQAYWAAHGGSQVEKAIAGSEEAKAFRAKRGW